MFQKLSLLGLCVAASLLAGCGSGGGDTTSATTGPSPTGTGAAKQEITIVSGEEKKGTTHPYWKSVHASAESCRSAELGVKIQWKGALKENDRDQEVNIVNQFVTDGVSGIVMAPLDSNALVGPVQAAMEKKIPVVIIDSALNGTPGKRFCQHRIHR